MKQRKDRIISSAILFSVILAGVCVVWWGYASQYQKILGTSPFSPMLQKPSSALVFTVLTAGLTAGIFLIQKETSVFSAADSRGGDYDDACFDQGNGMG